MALGIPNPNAFRASDENITFAIDAHAVGNSFALISLFISKNAAVRERAVGVNIVDANVFLRAVVHVEMLSIGREGEAVGLREIFCQQRDLAAVVETIDALIRDLLRLPFHQVERGVGEIDRAIGSYRDVVRTVEFLPFEVVGEDGVLAVRRDPNNRAQNARRVDKAKLTVVGIAVWIAQRDQFLFVPVGIDAKNLVDLFIADVDESGFIPDWTFGEAEARCDGFELGLLRNKLPESGRLCFQFEFSFRFLLRTGGDRAE